MQDFPRHRKVTDLVDDFDALRARCEGIGDQLVGLAVLFAAAAVLTLAGGIWQQAPLFAVSSGFALAAAAGFAASAHTALQASRAAPRARALAPAPVERLRKAA
jgi:uncharacterized membrane protein YjjP (DUF1212 family)